MVYPCQDPTGLQVFWLCFPLAPCPWPWVSSSFPCPQYPWWNKGKNSHPPALLQGSPRGLGWGWEWGEEQGKGWG